MITLELDEATRKAIEIIDLALAELNSDELFKRLEKQEAKLFERHRNFERMRPDSTGL